MLPTPGHTVGSITLLAEADGMRVAFTGDLIAAPGKVWSLAATQWSYNGAEGVAASIPSPVALKGEKSDRLLPSHGVPLDDPPAAIDLLVERLGSWKRARSPWSIITATCCRSISSILAAMRARRSVGHGFELRQVSEVIQ